MEEYRGEFNRPNKNGGYRYTKFQNDIDIYTNTPNNASGDTPTIIHAHGAYIDRAWYNSEEAALNRNSTCIFPASNTGRNPINVFENVYREVLNQKGNTENLILTGHSAGGPTTLKALATMYKEGKVNGEPPLVVMLDGSFKACKLTEEEIQILADNKVPIVAYYQLEEQTEYYKMLGKKGVNLAMIRDYEDRSHDKPSTNFFENKNGLFDFATGTGELMVGLTGYGVSVWSNGEEKYTNGVNLKDLSAVNTLDKIYAMMGIYTFNFKITHLQSISKTLLTNLSMNGNLYETNINQIISKIGNTAYISSNVDLSTSNSSSPTISKITNLSNEYFKTNTDLLFSISTELQEFKKISNIIYSTQKQIEKETTQLNHIKLPIEFSEHELPFETNKQL